MISDLTTRTTAAAHSLGQEDHLLCPGCEHDVSHLGRILLQSLDDTAELHCPGCNRLLAIERAPLLISASIVGRRES